MSMKIGSEQLGAWGNHTAGVAHREADGEAEVHETMADLFVVESGEATLVVGGQCRGGKTTAPNEIRGPKINGGERRKLAAGDIVHIPVKAPHQFWWKTASSSRTSSSKFRIMRLARRWSASAS